MISVLTTAYNQEKLIAASIRSILAQSYSDLELIVVDDGSTDGTLAVARSFNDPRMRVIEAGRVGRGRALNIGCRAARGEYIAIQDADDVSHPHRIEISGFVLGSYSFKSAVFGSAQLLFGGDSAPAVWDIPGTLDTDFVESELVLHNPVSHMSVMLRREWLERIGGYDETRVDLFDWELLVRLCAKGFRIVRLRHPLVAHRIHPGQFFEGRNRIRYAWHCAQMQWRAMRTLGRNPLIAASIPPLFVYRVLSRGIR